MRNRANLRVRALLEGILRAPANPIRLKKSEGTNLTSKEDIKPLGKPKVLNGFRSNILGQIGGLTLLLNRAVSFIVKIANQFVECLRLKSPSTPKSKQNIIQIE
jgi:hypothetical protein